MESVPIYITGQKMSYNSCHRCVITLHTCTRGLKQSVCPSVIVGTKNGLIWSFGHQGEVMVTKKIN